MNAQKYTQKSLEAVQNAQSIATEYGNQQIEQPHLLLALLLDEGGLIPQLLGNMGLTVPSFTAAAKAEVEVGLEDSEHAQIVSGLSGDELVISTWSSNLYEGAKIRLKEDTEETQTGQEA